MAATATKFPDVGGTAIPRRRPKVKRDLKQWTAIFDAQRTSGLSVESFCRANAISPSVYWKWRKIIGLTRKSSGVKADMPSFLPIPGLPHLNSLTIRDLREGL